MELYKIITLVDITRSGAHRNETNKIKIGQQSNFNSLIQTIGIRSNLQWFDEPKMYTGILPEDLEGKANHWIWEFSVEQPDIFLKSDNPVGHLIDDLNKVPIIADLNNTEIIDPAAFITKGNNVNTWLYKLNSQDK